MDFTSSKGDRVEGHKLYVCYPEENVTGVKTEEVFVKKNIKLPDVKINDDINIYFNSKGKVESVVK